MPGSYLSRLRVWLGLSPPLSHSSTRIVVCNAYKQYVDGHRCPFATNRISNTKYTLLNFVPKNLLAQCRYGTCGKDHSRTDESRLQDRRVVRVALASLS